MSKAIIRWPKNVGVERADARGRRGVLRVVADVVEDPAAGMLVLENPVQHPRHMDHRVIDPRRTRAKLSVR